MKYNKIMTLFAIVTPISILLRLYQLLFTTDAVGEVIKSTRRNNYAFYNFIIWIVIFIGILAVGVFGSLTYRNPKHHPKLGYFLLGSSVALGVGCAVSSFQVATAYSWLTLALKIMGLIAAAFFLAYAIHGIVSFKIPGFLFAIPVVYGIFRLIARFIEQNAKPLSMNSLFALLADCGLLVFYLEFGKEYNKLDREYNFKKLLSSGLFGSAMGFVYGVPHLICAIISPTRMTGVDMTDTLLITVSATFALAYIITHFSENNMRKHRRHHHKKPGNPGEDKQTLYVG